jgi:hypothetical protein
MNFLRNSLGVQIAVVSFVLGATAPVFAEPEYCSVDHFEKNELAFPVPGKNLKRIHTFKLGKVTLSGLGVGETSTSKVKSLSRIHSRGATKAQKYCTWYFNTLNLPSMLEFRWIHLPRPRGSPSIELEEKYMSRVQDEFFENDLNFLDCAKDHGFIALGCNSMKHRGPTVFAMLLAFSGCRAETATEIANHFWGLNGIEKDTRQSLAQAAYDYGLKNPVPSESLRNLFLNIE